MAEAGSNGSKTSRRRPPQVVAELAAGIDVDGVRMPAVVIIKAPDGQIQYSLQGLSPLEAPTIIEVGLRALRRDLGLAPLGGT